MATFSAVIKFFLEFGMMNVLRNFSKCIKTMKFTIGKEWIYAMIESRLWLSISF